MLNLHTHEEANDYLQHLKESYINSHAAFIIFEKFLMRNLNFCIWPSIIKLLDKAVIFMHFSFLSAARNSLGCKVSYKVS